MSEIERYMTELGEALHVRRAGRRRILRECRDHLDDAAADRGEAEAVRAFGRPRDIAAALDAEAAARRGVQSTAAAVAGVVATGVSTLLLVQGAADGRGAPVLSTIAFFVGAQVAGTAAALALLQALALRRTTMPPAELALLARRNVTALLAAGVTVFAAGSAVAGRRSAAAIVGPTVACGALAFVVRAYAQTRRLSGARSASTRSPFVDLGELSGFDIPVPGTARLTAFVACVAAGSAFLRATAEHAAIGEALADGAIEALAVVAGVVVLGRALGLWAGPSGRTADR